MPLERPSGVPRPHSSYPGSCGNRRSGPRRLSRASSVPSLRTGSISRGTRSVSRMIRPVRPDFRARRADFWPRSLGTTRRITPRFRESFLGYRSRASADRPSPHRARARRDARANGGRSRTKSAGKGRAVRGCLVRSGASSQARPAIRKRTRAICRGCPAGKSPERPRRARPRRNRPVARPLVTAASRGGRSARSTRIRSRIAACRWLPAFLPVARPLAVCARPPQ